MKRREEGPTIYLLELRTSDHPEKSEIVGAYSNVELAQENARRHEWPASIRVIELDAPSPRKVVYWSAPKEKILGHLPERPSAPTELAEGAKVRLTEYGRRVVEQIAEEAKGFMGVKHVGVVNVKAGDEGFVTRRMGAAVWECKFWGGALVVDGYMVEPA